jgi:alginate O-acetyltransferase complex protein AlgI
MPAAFQDIANALIFHPGQPLTFNSVLFIGLFTLMYAVYSIVSGNLRKRNLLLTAFSLYFYYLISGWFVLLMIFMAFSDFLIGKKMAGSGNEKTRKLLLWLSVFINIGALVFFKYTNFLLNSAFSLFTGESSPVLLNLLMPLGISFFVFKTLSYILDIYRENIEKAETNFVSYLLYVSFFANLPAGPIAKARELLPQINRLLYPGSKEAATGFLLILTGAFKKVFIADFLGANLVDRVFESPEFFTGFEGLMAVYAYALQIYCDFSGYTDMVIGMAMLLGFSIPSNFNKPYFATNVADFWRRWHITLSSWLNEYVFFPLSYYFRKYKMSGTILAVLVTFLISGIWHGPAWTYIFWGLSHGIAIAFTTSSRNWLGAVRKKTPARLYRFLSILITFHFLAFSMVLFRAPDLSSAWNVYELVFSKFSISPAAEWAVLYWKPLVIMLVGYAMHFVPLKAGEKFTTAFSRIHWSLKAVCIALAVLLIYQAFSSDAQPFIYLEF